MTEEEKRAIEELKHFKKDKDCRYWIGENGIKAIDTISNLIKKLLKEVEETQPIIEVLENFGKNGLGEYSKRYFAEYSAIHHTAFYDFIPDPDEIYKKYYEQKKEIEKLKKENEELNRKLKVQLETNLRLVDARNGIENEEIRQLNNFIKNDCILKDKIEGIKNKNIGQYMNFYREIEELLEEE